MFKNLEKLFFRKNRIFSIKKSKFYVFKQFSKTFCKANIDNNHSNNSKSSEKFGNEKLEINNSEKKADGIDKEKNEEENEEFQNKSILEQMENYNKNYEYSKVISLYETLLDKEKKGKILIQYKIAARKINEHYKILSKLKSRSDNPGIFVRQIIIFVFGCIILIGVYKFYSEYFFSNESQNSTPKNKKSTFFSDLFNVFDFELSMAKNIKERLVDVKGIDEVKEEIEQIILMIKNPQQYTDAGAKLHKGILLCGKPGTGKTLIARAIAGDAGMNFFFLTGSDFDEMFVGVGASRIRKLFEKAREKTPCIIFIDEIDSLLSSSRRTNEHSSSRSTLNQFLAEMDGFNRLDQIYVIGATNHESDLDNAATRPGRFDKIIHINIPDEEGRIDIINFYLNKVKIEKSELDPKYLAKLTPGFTGADIENLVNLSILRALSLDKNRVDMADFFEARDRVLMGISRKNSSITEKTRYHTSLHEAGHTLICYKNPTCRKTLHKVTIIPRGSAAGVTLMLADEDSLYTKSEFLTNIDTCMGGHVAEELIYGSDSVTAGCSSDLNKATQIAQAMVKKFGMYGENVGYIYVEDEGYSWEENINSEKYKRRIDEAIKVILKESHDRVYLSLKNSANELKNLAQKLYQYDDLNFNELEAAIEGRFSEIKRQVIRQEFSEDESGKIKI